MNDLTLQIEQYITDQIIQGAQQEKITLDKYKFRCIYAANRKHKEQKRQWKRKLDRQITQQKMRHTLFQRNRQDDGWNKIIQQIRSIIPHFIGDYHHTNLDYLVAAHLHLHLNYYVKATNASLITQFLTPIYQCTICDTIYVSPIQPGTRFIMDPKREYAPRPQNLRSFDINIICYCIAPYLDISDIYKLASLNFHFRHLFIKHLVLPQRYPKPTDNSNYMLTFSQFNPCTLSECIDERKLRAQFEEDEKYEKIKDEERIKRINLVIDFILGIIGGIIMRLLI